MKTTTPTYDSAKKATSGTRVYTLLEIDADAETLYYSDQAATVSGQAYAAKVKSFGGIKNKTTPGEEVIRKSDMFLELFNTPRIDSQIKAGLQVRLYIWLGGTSADKLLWFKGIIKDDINVDSVYSISFSCQDIGEYFNKRIGTVLDSINYPNADPNDIGKAIPIVIGDVKNHRCLATTAGFASTSAEDFTGGGGSIILTDSSFAPNSGQVLVGNETGTYTGKSGNTLTGLTGLLEDYVRGDRVIENVSSLEYHAADHTSVSLSNAKIVPFGGNIKDAISIPAASVSYNTNDGGKSTVTITDPTAVRNSVVVATQPDQPITTQPVKVSPSHGHTPTNQTVPYYFDSVPTFPATRSNIGRLVNNEFVDEASGAFTDNLLFKIQKAAIQELNGTMVSAVLKVNAREAAAAVGKVNMKFVFNGVTKIDEQKTLNNTLTTFSTSSFSLSGGDWSDFQNANTYIELKRTDGIGGTITIFFGEAWLELTYTPANPTTAVAVNESVASVSNRIVDAYVGGNSVADTLGGYLVVDIQGVPDNSSGHYTGVANALIEEPWDVYHYLIETFSNGAVHADIDITGSFADAEANLSDSTMNYNFSFVITEPTELNLLLALLAPQTWCRFSWEAGLAKLNRRKDSDDSTIKAVNTNATSYLSSDKRLQIRKKIKGLPETFNDVEVKYNLNYNLGGWGNANAYEGSESDTNAASITDLGTRTKTFLMFAVGDNSTMAADLQDKWLDFYAVENKATISLPGSLANSELELGDVIELTSPQLGILNKSHEVLEADYLPPMPLNRQSPRITLSLLDLLFGYMELADSVTISDSFVFAEIFTESVTVTANDIDSFQMTKNLADRVAMGDGETFLADGTWRADGTIPAIGDGGEISKIFTKNLTDSISVTESIQVLLNP